MTLLPVALDFDGGLDRQPRLRGAVAAAVDLRGCARAVRLACRAGAAARVREVLRGAREVNPGPWLAFLGSGDYHHVTLMLLEMLGRPQRPVTLVLIDNHPDWQGWPPRHHCGNWVAGAIRLPGIAGAVMVGMDSPDLGWKSLYAAPLAALAESRVRIFPWRANGARIPLRWTRTAGGPVSNRFWGTALRFEPCAGTGVEGVFERIAGALDGGDIYLSIDKDCLRQEDAPSDWEQGGMSLAQLTGGIGILRERCGIIGADVCGDRAATPFEGFFRRLDAGRLGAPWRPPTADDFARMEVANMAILGALTGSARGSRAGGLHGHSSMGDDRGLHPDRDDRAVALPRLEPGRAQAVLHRPGGGGPYRGPGAVAPPAPSGAAGDRAAADGGQLRGDRAGGAAAVCRAGQPAAVGGGGAGGDGLCAGGAGRAVGSATGAYRLLAALLVVDVAVFVLQKGASRSAGAEGGQFLWNVARSPLLWLAIVLAPVQLTLWARILRRSDIGWAYPITALAYPLTMLAAVGLFGERYGWPVWLGAVLIACGAVVIGPPAHTRNESPRG